MKEQWIVEAERNAKDTARRIYKQITREADYISIDRKWYFEKVVHYMTTESDKSYE